MSICVAHATNRAILCAMTRPETDEPIEPDFHISGDETPLEADDTGINEPDLHISGDRDYATPSNQE